MKKNWLYNKNVLLTGASSGIGRDMTKILIEKYNCKVLGVGRNEEKMKSLLQELKDKSGNFSYKLFDVSVEKNWEDLRDFFVDNNFQMDLLVNNAGQLPKFKTFEKYTIKDAEDIMQVNYFSNVYAIHYLLPLVKKSATPAVVNVCSSASLCAIPGISIYSASKAALKNFTESLRGELQGKVYVGLMCPGFTKTNIFRNQGEKVGSKLVGFISMDSIKMAKKIVRAIKRKRRYKYFGADASCMNTLYKLFPSSASGTVGDFLKLWKLELFEDVYDYPPKKLKKK